MAAPLGEAWSRSNAVVLLAACAAALAIGQPWPLAVAALLSFGALLVTQRNDWTPSGRFGPANGVTAARLLLVVALGTCLHRAPGLLVAALLVGIFALDGLDGVLARRSGSASAFGAHFDMETDAYLVLAVTLELHQRGQAELWILSAGLLRYLYVLCLAIAPASAGEMPRSQPARYAFAVCVAGFGLALGFPTELGTAGALVGCTALVLSFARSFYWSYAPGRAAVARS